MFTWFQNNRGKYQKGQVAPFLILIIVFVIMMTMVTVNLSKVATTKTESSNAADAGSLASGSMMANAFNALAKSSDDIETEYATFLLTAGALAAIIDILGAADIIAVWTGSIMIASYAPEYIGTLLISLALAIAGCHAAQVLSFLSIEESMDDYVFGDKGAVSLGHKMAFYNSGIGSRLKENGADNNSRDTFSNFVQNCKGDPSYTYSWTDGQGRGHSVTTSVTTQKVDEYELRYAILPSIAAIAGLLVLRYTMIETLEIQSILACVYFMLKDIPYLEEVFYPLWIESATQATIYAGIIMAAVSLTMGMLAIEFDGDDSLAEDTFYTIFMIRGLKDIEHDRKISVGVSTHHDAGADLGIWRMQYPDTYSFSKVDFRGNGSIWPPVFEHDATMVETDISTEISSGGTRFRPATLLNAP